MSFTTITTLLSIFLTVFEFPIATSAPDFLSPLLSPVLGNLCKEVGCGKGKCKISDENDLRYKCECDPGWKQSVFSNQSALPFLPCVIPNCTLNYSCSEAAAPAPSRETPFNASIFDPCHWANCGGGSCNKTSTLTYACECKEGYMNLFNNTGFPCFRECSIGGDCSNLGIPVSNRSTTPAPNLPDRASNQGSASSLQREALFHGIVVAVITLACSV